MSDRSRSLNSSYKLLSEQVPENPAPVSWGCTSRLCISNKKLSDMKFTVNIGASTNLDRLDGSRSAVTERSQQHIARWTVSACFWQDFAKPEGSRGAKTCTVLGLQTNIRYNGLKVWHTANMAHIRVIYLRDPLFSDIILSVKAAMATESSAPVAALDTQVLAAAAADTDICELRQAPDSSGQVLGVFSTCTIRTSTVSTVEVTSQPSRLGSGP